MMIKLILKIIERFYHMFWYGENFNEIRSMCLVDYANYLHDKKEIEKAIKYYNKALRLDPNNYYAYGGLTAAFIEKRLFSEALEYYNKAMTIKKPDTLMLILGVIIYESLGEFVLSKEALNNALKFFDNNLAALYNHLSYTLFSFNMNEKSEFYCKEAIKMYPSEAGLHNNLAKIYLAQGKFYEARDEFQKVAELTSDKRYKRYAIKNIKKIAS